MSGATEFVFIIFESQRAGSPWTVKLRLHFFDFECAVFYAHDWNIGDKWYKCIPQFLKKELKIYHKKPMN